MNNVRTAFSGFSAKDIEEVKEFYVSKLGLKLLSETMGLEIELPGGSGMFIYQKDDHTPATFTVLNFVVDNITDSVNELKAKGIMFEEYDFGGGAQTDKNNIMRGKASNQGPDVAWFKDPAGNILSVLES